MLTRAWVRLWLCQFFGHPDKYRTPTNFDGINVYATCARCGYRGLITSHGHLV